MLIRGKYKLLNFLAICQILIRGPGAFTFSLDTCQLETRFMSNSNVATTYVNEVIYIDALLVSLSPKKLLHFSLRPAVFELQAIQRRVH